MSRCKFYDAGSCRYGDRCKFSHQRQTCKWYQQGHCKFGDKCKYEHIEKVKTAEEILAEQEWKEMTRKWAEEAEIYRKEREIERKREEEIERKKRERINTSLVDSLLFLPTEILKIICDQIYLNDVVLVCKLLNEKLCQLYPLVTFNISDVDGGGYYVVCYEKARNIEDAIYQRAIKSIWNNYRSVCYSFHCMGDCITCRRNRDILNKKSDLSLYEKEYPQFAIFRQRLRNDPIYHSRSDKKFKEAQMETDPHKREFYGRGDPYRYQRYLDLKIFNTYFKMQNKTFRPLKM